MYLDERLRNVPAGRFIEIGPGSGETTQLLPHHGWTGTSYNLGGQTIRRFGRRLSDVVSPGLFRAVNSDFLQTTSEDAGRVDLVIWCIAMSHMDGKGKHVFMRKASGLLVPQGAMIGVVPSSLVCWGIENDIVGDCQRFTRAAIRDLKEGNGWKLGHVAGLTFPVSNLLLPVSNYLVNRAERSEPDLSLLERTKQSGGRNMPFKTHFSSVLGLLLNRITLSPAYLIQKLFPRSERALVLYFGASPARAQDP